MFILWLFLDPLSLNLLTKECSVCLAVEDTHGMVMEEDRED
jgi:hypothetical protein